MQEHLGTRSFIFPPRFFDGHLNQFIISAQILSLAQDLSSRSRNELVELRQSLRAPLFIKRRITIDRLPGIPVDWLAFVPVVDVDEVDERFPERVERENEGITDYNQESLRTRDCD